MAATTDESYDAAVRALENADHWMNRDGSLTLESRALRAGVQAQMAQAYATLAVADATNALVLMLAERDPA